MFDLSWGEVLVIGGVALIVIGPKDLPKALRTVGQMTAKMRRMAGEFQAQFNEAMREAELDEVKKQIEGVNQSVASLGAGLNPIQTVRDELKGAIDTQPSAATAAGAPAPMIGPDAHADPADPADLPSVDLPTVPPPPREPPLPAQPEARPVEEPAVKSPPA
jgi:sec-independent protein translocase protein TatB